VGHDETAEDLQWLTKKLVQLRIFDDAEGVMNCSVQDVEGEVMVVSQFTLHALTKKGNRPSWIKAAPEAISKPLYEEFVAKVEAALGRKVATGSFGADMKIELTNDGPVTIWIDSKNRE
jgi:D-tyrosyl-tRNA(Tyr) deacylase